MKIRFQLRHLLGLDHGDTTLEGVAAEIGISRHQLMHLLDNNAKQISREALEKCCEYLIGHGILSREDLPHKLFLVETSAFWPLLAKRQRVEIVMGVRWLKRLGIDQQVMAADAMLESVLVNQLTGVRAERSEEAGPGRHPQQVIDLRLAACWGAEGTTVANIQSESRRLFKTYQKGPDDKGIICVGSIKSNPMCDMLVASGFRKAKPFVSEDGVLNPSERSCPFFMLYRDDDPHPASCWAGRRLAKPGTAREDWPTSPGIYFETADQKWVCLPCGKLRDAALVYYHFLNGENKLEVVLGGYTGRSTRGLAEMLRGRESDNFWPPQIDNDDVRVGAFLVRFRYRKRKANEGIEVRPHQREIDHEIIPLHAEVLDRRLAAGGRKKGG